MTIIGILLGDDRSLRSTCIHYVLMLCVTDKDYEFSVDLDIIILVESDPFYGLESETVVAHLTKLNDIATLFTHDEKSLYLYILKIFPFSLKGDAKTWFNSLDPGCVRSP